MNGGLRWPDSKAFAFSIFDDTDLATIHNVPEVYRFLADTGFLTTKSVWPVRGAGKPVCGGDTCEDGEYLQWLHRLQRQGFEIGYHMNTYHSSTREETEAGLDTFVRLFGRVPRTMANHVGCDENIYWGDCRVSGINRVVYNLLTRYRNRGRYRGHVEGDPLFWGDLCRDKITYCRNFVFPDINTLRACPFMPYHDPDRPYVNYWYASSEGPHVDSFIRLLAEANQDRLEAEGGACIVYTHLAGGFYDGGRLHPRFRALMERLGKKNGWFVPVATLLDYLREQRGRHVITRRQRACLERKWLRHKLATGTS